MKKEAKYILKLRRVARYSYSVIIPKELVKKYGWRERQKLTIKDMGRGKLQIKDWKKN